MPEIDSLRDDIAALDAEIVALVGRRLALAERIGAYKREYGLPVVVPDVEARVKERYVDAARKAGVPAETAEAIATLLIAASRTVQE